MTGGTGGPTSDLGVGSESVPTMDAFVASYDARGHHRWSYLQSASEHARGWDIAIDETGEVTVTIEVSGDLDPGTGMTTRIGGTDTVLVRYDESGTPLWPRRFGAEGQSLIGESVASNHAGDLVVVGRGTGFRARDRLRRGAVGPFDDEGAFVVGLDAIGDHRYSRPEEASVFLGQRSVGAVGGLRPGWDGLVISP